MGMFRFLDGTPERAHRFMDVGVAPWWTYEKIRLSFWRPITALTHVLDYGLWPSSSELMHLQSMLWFALLVVAAGMLYRRIIGVTWAAGLAAFLFAIDDVHGAPVFWLANRHALIAAIFGILTLCAHDHGRKGDGEKWKYLAPMLLFLGLLSSEATAAAFGYLLSYTLFLDTGPMKERIKVLAPYIFLLIIWRVVYNILGYGASGSDTYVDPIREPLRFCFAVLQRLPILLFGGLAWPPADIYLFFSTHVAPIFAVTAIVLILAACGLFLPIWRHCKRSHFWMLGIVLSALPFCAAIPSNRNLTLVAFGAVGLLAQWIYGLLHSSASLPQSRLWRIPVSIGCCILLFIHIICAPLSLRNQLNSLRKIQPAVEQLVDIGISDRHIAQQDVILVNPPTGLFISYLLPIRFLNHLPIPAHIRMLAPGYDDLQLYRKDENTLVVRPEGGYFRRPGPLPREQGTIASHIGPSNILRHFESLFRSETHPMRLGQKVKLNGVTIEITGLTEDGRPAEATFRFDFDLENNALIWLRWNSEEGRYVNYVPPRAGETVTVKGTDFSNIFVQK
ncbi:MAG: hypothetical protein ABIH23_31240 [bacterium]